MDGLVLFVDFGLTQLAFGEELSVECLYVGACVLFSGDSIAEDLKLLVVLFDCGGEVGVHQAAQGDDDLLEAEDRVGGGSAWCEAAVVALLPEGREEGGDGGVHGGCGVGFEGVVFVLPLDVVVDGQEMCRLLSKCCQILLRKLRKTLRKMRNNRKVLQQIIHCSQDALRLRPRLWVHLCRWSEMGVGWF